MARRSSGQDRLLRHAERLYHKGQLDASWQICALVLANAPRDDDASRRAFDRARALEIQAVVHQDRGESENALRAYHAAEEAVKGWADHRVFLGRIQLSLAQQYGLLGFGDDTLKYLDLAAQNVKGSEYEPYVTSLRSGLETEDDTVENWQDQVAQMRKQLAELKATGPTSRRHSDALMRQQVGIRQDIARLQILYGSDEEAVEAFVEIGKMACDGLDKRNDLREFLSLTDALSFLLDRPRLTATRLLTDLIDRASKAARRTGGSMELTAQVYFLAALRALKPLNLSEAIGNALASVALTADCLALTNSAALRQLLKRRLDERRDLALTLAIKLEDSATAAELIETDRLQALPRSGLQLPAAAQPRADASSIQSTRAELSALGHVSVRGVSQLFVRSSRQALQVSPSVVALEDVIARVGGSGAWWWGCFVALRRIHWVVRSPDGAMTCGTKNLNNDEVATMEELDGDLTLISQGVPAWDDLANERDLFARLADVILPPVLRNIASSNHSVSLVVCGNLVAALPLAGLVLDKASDVRLIERAVIRMQPPASLVGMMPPQASTPANHPLLVACMDPTGDLDNAMNADLAPLVSLTHRRHQPLPRRQATRANLMNALNSFPPGSPGIFFYSGHVGYLDLDGGLNTILKLQDDDLLAAGDWFRAFGDGTALACPSRVLVSACNSGGTSGTGGGEWLGLAAALLFAGARQVIATAWPIFDTRFTGAFDAALLNSMESLGDPGYLLALEQRAALDAWRQQTVADDRDKALPAIWCAYQCVGIVQ